MVETQNVRQVNAAETVTSKPYLWLLYQMSFMEVFIGTLFGIALPNVLIFDNKMTSGFIGIIWLVSAFAFLLGPVLLTKPSRKFGIRKTLIFCDFIGLVVVIGEVYFPYPSVLLVATILDGLFISIFWANIDAVISRVQKKGTQKQKVKTLNWYGLSWNVGAVLGEFIGFMMTFLGSNDKFVLFICVLLTIIQIPITALIKIPHEEDFKQNSEPKVIPKVSNKKLRIKKIKASYYLVIPLVVVFFGDFIYESTKGVYSLLFPFILLNLQEQTFWTYMGALGQQLLQIVAILIVNRLNPKAQYQAYLTGIMGLIGLTFLTIIFPAQLLVIVIILMGFCCGLIYVFPLQVTLNYGTVGDSLKYAGYSEMFTAIGYGVLPVIAGFVAEINLMFNYKLLMQILVVSFLISIGIYGRVQQQRKVNHIVISIYFPPEIFREVIAHEKTIIAEIPPDATDPMVFGQGPFFLRSVSKRTENWLTASAN